MPQAEMVSLRIQQTGRSLDRPAVIIGDVSVESVLTRFATGAAARAAIPRIADGYHVARAVRPRYVINIDVAVLLEVLEDLGVDPGLDAVRFDFLQILR